jgi:hypothetical protein
MSEKECKDGEEAFDLFVDHKKEGDSLNPT